MTRPVFLVIFAVAVIGILIVVNNLSQQASNESTVSTNGNDSTVAETPLAGWKEFHAQTGKFKASLPDTPHYVQDVTDIPGTDKKRHYDVYAAQKVNGTIFMISQIIYPPDYDIVNSDELLRELIAEIAQNNPRNRLEQVSDSTYQNQKALDFRISNDEFLIEGKAFLNKHTAYLLTYAARKDDFDEKEYQHFLDSFQVLKTEK